MKTSGDSKLGINSFVGILLFCGLCSSLCFSLSALQKLKMSLLYHEFLCLLVALWDKFVFSALQKFKMLVVSWMFWQKCWMLWILEIVRYSSYHNSYILFLFTSHLIVLTEHWPCVEREYMCAIVNVKQSIIYWPKTLTGQWFGYLFQCHC